MTPPSPAQILAQVRSVLGKSPDARIIGIHVRSGLTFPTTLRINGDELPVANCDSVLGLRERLVDLPDQGPLLVLLTTLTVKDLGADVIARLARHQLHEIEPWFLVRERFRARYVDPRLVHERSAWVAEALLDAEPEGGYQPVAAGVLDSETVWRALFQGWLDLPDGARDPETLLEWSLSGAHRDRVAALPDHIRDGMCIAVRESAGDLAGDVFDCLAGTHAAHVLSIGLVARVLFEGEGDKETARAAVRLERYHDNRPIERPLALAWADASEAVIDRRLTEPEGESVRPLLDAAGELLRELGAASAAVRSRFLAGGLVLRLEAFAGDLERIVDDASSGDPWTHVRSISEHALAEGDPEMTSGVRMAARLATRLGSRPRQQEETACSLAEAAERYRAKSGYVDWARSKLREAPASGPLATAYARIIGAVDALRETENRRFAELLAEATRSGASAPALLPVENVLQKIVVPLARSGPVLLVVVDGMAVPVHRELQEDLARAGWVELVPEAGPARFAVVAALPTVTHVSRASLLCGRLVSGPAAREVEGFTTHRGLLEASEPKKPPVLYHKADLNADGGIGVAPSVLEEIGDHQRRVVGVVLNAVDDLLAKGDQLRIEWNAHVIRPLEELLTRAREAQRIVVLVSDHGHVLEWGTKARDGEGGRWREATRDAEDGEVVLEGKRVLLGTDQRLVAPWSERIRYGAKRAGYHGGVTPQETVIPLGVYAQAGAWPEGWREGEQEVPEWWVSPEARAVPRPEPRKPLPALKTEGPGQQGQLFVKPKAKETTVEADWIDRLIASPTFGELRERATRTPVGDERLRTVLSALDARGGKLTRAALARSLSISPLRMGTLLSVIRRLLNVDGFPVVSLDEASDTVVLDRGLLEKQFGLAEEESA